MKSGLEIQKLKTGDVIEFGDQVLVDDKKNCEVIDQKDSWMN